MSKTILQIKQYVQDKTGYNYADGINSTNGTDLVLKCINDALKEIYLVKFNFMLLSGNVTIAANYGDLPSDFSMIDEVYCSSQRLTRGDRRSLILSIEDVAGQSIPKNYVITGYNTSTNRRKICVGNPSYNSGSIIVSYWKLPTEHTSNTEYPELTYFWTEKPIVDYSSFLLYNTLEMYDKASQCFQEFRIDMKNRELVLGFEGESYEDIIIAREKIYNIENKQVAQ
jgi:hypothetical protein